MNAPFVLALPSKGRLHEQALAFLSECGFAVAKSGDGREYTAKLKGIDGVGVLYLRPDEIPSRVELGDVHIGLTGEDLYREYGEGQGASHLLMPNLGFGGARLVIGVPQSWIDVSTLDDLDEAAMLFHRKHGRSLRVATKFARLTRAFFARHGIVEYTLVESAGATEGAPAAGIADLIVDLTSTGATLAQNHLKEIAGGTVVDSHCCMIAALKPGLWTTQALGALEHLVEQIEARRLANDTLVLRFSLPEKTSTVALDTLGKRFACTVSAVRPQDEPDGRRVHVVAMSRHSGVYAATRFLREQGAADVIVDRSEFLYRGSSPAVAAFRALLESRKGGAHG